MVATDDKGEIVYDKIPRETIITEGKGECNNKLAGAVNKLY